MNESRKSHKVFTYLYHGGSMAGTLRPGDRLWVAPVDMAELLNRAFPHDIVDPKSGETIARANEAVTEEIVEGKKPFFSTVDIQKESA